MKFCRIQALIEELIHDWDELNLAAKVLIYLGFFLIFSTVFISFYEVGDMEVYIKIEVIFRTCLASVFGFILSSNTKNKSISNKIKNNILEKMITSEKSIEDLEKEDAITTECKIQKETLKYYYGEGNTVQVVVALIIALLCSLIILIAYVIGNMNDMAILGQFRDLMCSSIGFLLGEAKIRPRN